MSMNMTVYQIVNEFKRFEEVIAITLAGSGASGRKDSFSDIDINVIVSKDINLDKRKNIIKKFADMMELNNNFWGLGDEFILRNSSTQVDIAYFNIDWLKDGLINVLENYKASIGYTTCFWHNVKNAVIVYDKNNVFRDLQQKYTIDFPKELKKNIIDMNYPILRNCFSSYYYQIEKAINRKDLISINHRISAFLASYFDIIFAINEIPHPGEKRLVTIVEKSCKKKPSYFTENIDKLLTNAAIGNHEILDNILDIVNGLEQLLIQEELIKDIDEAKLSI